MYAVRQNGLLRWFEYGGLGEANPAGNRGWAPNSGNPIGRGWNNLLNLASGGDGVLYGVEPNGDLRWFMYDGGGESDPSGATGWHSNSGNVIGNGWHGLRFLFSTPFEGTVASTILGAIFAVDQNGGLRWFRYLGDGTHDPSGNTGWHPNSGNAIGRGWSAGFRFITAVSNVILAVEDDGDLRWYKYVGEGENDPTGGTGWAPGSGNVIGRGWDRFRVIFGGIDWRRGGYVIYGIASDGSLVWYRYTGSGESDPSGSRGWDPNSGNVIGNGW
jgi:hypothetical protein